MAASRSGGDSAGGQMEIEPVKSTRIYEEIVRQVKRLIAEGKLKSGDRLPPERDLVEKFMVSRTAVREALRVLEAAIASLAAGRATREEIAEMERILEEQHQEVLQGRTGVVQDTALHSAIAHSAHNRAITRIVSALMDLLTQSREESLHTPGRPTRSHADHRRILEAIHRRDAPAHRKKRSTKS